MIRKEKNSGRWARESEKGGRLRAHHAVGAHQGARGGRGKTKIATLGKGGNCKRSTPLWGPDQKKRRTQGSKAPI